MKKIVQYRQTGKTVKLIKMSADKNIPMIVRNDHEAARVRRTAETFGLNIPDPIPVKELDRIVSLDKVIVDDAEYVLADILKRQHHIGSVKCVAITEGEEFDEDNPGKYKCAEDFYTSVLTVKQLVEVLIPVYTIKIINRDSGEILFDNTSVPRTINDVPGWVTRSKIVGLTPNEPGEGVHIYI